MAEELFDAPIPGMSLTHELGDRPWQTPAQFPTVDEAIEYYTKVLELDPKRISSSINLAAIYSKKEEYTEATSILHQSLKDNPDESDLWLNYAILMVKQKKFHEAIESYSKAVEVAPNDWKFKARAVQEKEKVEDWKSLYYELEGWDAKTGWPTNKTLRENGLNKVADEMKKQGKHC